MSGRAKKRARQANYDANPPCCDHCVHCPTYQTVLKSSLSQTPIPESTLAYFRRQFANSLHQLVLSTFSTVERENGVTRAEVARRIGRKPEQITRWLGTPSNWTIETISDLLVAMGKKPALSTSELFPSENPVPNLAARELRMDAGTVLLTVAEVEAMEQGGISEQAYNIALQAMQAAIANSDALRAELAAKDAEIAELVDELRWAKSAVHNRNEMIERLRKGKDAQTTSEKSPMARVQEHADDTAASICGRSAEVARLSLALATVDPSQPLDHRLGLPLVDAEPCEPMSGRVPYRWGMLA